MSPGSLALVFIGAIVAAIAIEYRVKGGKTRPLADRFGARGPDRAEGKPELGTEAIDHAAFNRAMGQNNALAAMNGARSRWHAHQAMEAHLMTPLPPKNDETNVTRAEREAMARSTASGTAER